jgi:hypothetical protein
MSRSIDSISSSARKWLILIKELFVRSVLNGHDFTACEKLCSFERARLRPGRQNCGMSPALAAEGWVFLTIRTFSASCSAVPLLPKNLGALAPEGTA